MRIYLYLCLCAVLAVGCGPKKDAGIVGDASEKRIEMEADGRKCLQQAREELAAGRYDAARIQLKQLRDKYPLALNAREEGILLSDSIDLKETEEQFRRTDSLLLAGSGDSVALKAAYEELLRKTKFYQRKLRHDKSKKQVH